MTRLSDIKAEDIPKGHNHKVPICFSMPRPVKFFLLKRRAILESYDAWHVCCASICSVYWSCRRTAIYVSCQRHLDSLWSVNKSLENPASVFGKSLLHTCQIAAKMLVMFNLVYQRIWKVELRRGLNTETPDWKNRYLLILERKMTSLKVEHQIKYYIYIIIYIIVIYYIYI